MPEDKKMTYDLIVRGWAKLSCLPVSPVEHIGVRGFGNCGDWRFDK